jgi:hypothetical protein
MLKDVEKIAKKYFDKSVTDRERAIFEGAITLGATYHQFAGTPIAKNEKVVKSLEEAVSNVMALQPYKKSIRLKIDRNALKGEKTNPYDYETLKGHHMGLQVITEYGDSRATLRMRRIPELNYTLMYVEKIEKITK